MPGQLSPEDSARLSDWIAQVSAALAVDLEVPTGTVLGLAADVAHHVVRPAAPVTGFLLGAALATSPGLTPEGAAARVRAVLDSFPPADASGTDGSAPA